MTARRPQTAPHTFTGSAGARFDGYARLYAWRFS